MKVRELLKLERPRERMIKYGPKKLSNAELLAIILGTGIKGTNVIELARKILFKFKVKNLSELEINDLKNISGLGQVKCCQIIASLELGKRIFTNLKSVILSPKDIWEELRDIRGSKKEYFIAFYLNINNEVIKKEIISIGTLDSSLVHPREIFEPAVKNLAAQIILVHNHPSGNCQPSDEDIKTTKQLIEAGKIMGIEIIDHIIVTEKEYLSMKEKGII